MTTFASAPTAQATPIRPPAHRTAMWRAGATSVVWGTSLFVAALWVSGGGITAIAGMDAETLSSLGRLCGLVSANLLLYQVLLMARVPMFERGFGRDAMTRMHRFVGFWSFWLLLAHIVLLVVGYAVAAGVNPLVQLWEFVWDYPGMLLATAGTGLILLVVVTSIRRARRRLRYESWHLLHLYAYLGVGLALPHQLWTGADFLSSPAATIYWWTLWAAAAASVVVFRIALPLLRSWRHGVRVTSVEREGTGLPAEGAASATVVSDGLEHADVWATAAVVAGFDDISWIERAGTRTGLLVSPGGEVRRWVDRTEVSITPFRSRPWAA